MKPFIVKDAFNLPRDDEKPRLYLVLDTRRRVRDTDYGAKVDEEALVMDYEYKRLYWRNLDALAYVSDAEGN